MIYLLVPIIALLLLYIGWQRLNLSAHNKALSFFARAASELMHSLDGSLRKATAEKRAQRDLLALVGALASLLEENPKLITRDTLLFLRELSHLFREDCFAKEKKALVSRVEVLHIRQNRG